MRDPKEVLKGMRPWQEFGSAVSAQARTAQQRAFDSGVLAASEFIRRITGDESLAGAVHLLLSKSEVHDAN